MTLQQLEYIIAVDSHRHFAKAAEHCHVTQPTLSAMIQKLEEELGVRIFDRSTQPVTTTNLGKKIIQQARSVLGNTQHIKEIVAEEQGAISGTFRLGILPTIAPYLLPRFYLRFMDKHPKLDIRMAEMKISEIETALDKGELDAAITATAPENKQLTSQLLYFEEFFGYVSTLEPIFNEKIIRTSDITGKHLWLLDEGHCFRDQLLKFCSLEGVQSRIAYRLGSMETFMRMVESGQGITIIPELALDQLNTCQQELVRPFALPRPTRQIRLVTRHDFVRHTLLELLREEIRNSVPSSMHALKSNQYEV